MVEGQKFKVIFHFWLHKTDSRQYYTLKKKKKPCSILPTPFRAEIHLNLVYVLWGRVLDSFLSLYQIYWLSNIYQDPPFPMNAVVWYLHITASATYGFCTLPQCSIFLSLHTGSNGIPQKLQILNLVWLVSLANGQRQERGQVTKWLQSRGWTASTSQGNKGGLVVTRS